MGDNNKKVIVHIDPDLEAIIPRFMEIRNEDIQIIKDALMKEDFESITRIGHSMKGAGGSYGFESISKIGAAIEIAGKDKKGEEIMRLINDLAQYMENLEIVFDGG